MLGGERREVCDHMIHYQAGNLFGRNLQRKGVGRLLGVLHTRHDELWPIESENNGRRHSACYQEVQVSGAMTTAMQRRQCVQFPAGWVERRWHAGWLPAKPVCAARLGWSSRAVGRSPTLIKRGSGRRLNEFTLHSRKKNWKCASQTFLQHSYIWTKLSPPAGKILKWYFPPYIFEIFLK